MDAQHLKFYDEAQALADEFSDDVTEYSVVFSDEFSDNIVGEADRYIIDASRDGSTVLRVEISLAAVEEHFNLTQSNALEALLNYVVYFLENGEYLDD